MQCDIYKSSKKDEMYVYIARPDLTSDSNSSTSSDSVAVHDDALAGLPEALKIAFGRPIFVMHLELTEQRKLARVSTLHVMDSLKTKGYFMQMPPEGLINPNAVAPEGLRGA